MIGLVIFQVWLEDQGWDLAELSAQSFGNHFPAMLVPFALGLLVVLCELLHNVLDESSWSFCFSTFSAASLHYLKLCFNFLEICDFSLCLGTCLNTSYYFFFFFFCCVHAAHEKQNSKVGKSYINNHPLIFFFSQGNWDS